MQYVLTVAETRSFTSAAKRLYLSQPSLSQTIIALEKELGVTLFDRSSTPLTLTYAGEQFVNAAQSMFIIEEELMSRMSDISSSHSGHLSVGVSLFRNSSIVARVLPHFYKLYPDVKVTLKENTNDHLLEMALSGGTDLAFITGNVPSDLTGVHILSDKLLLAVGRGHHMFSPSGNMAGYRKVDLQDFTDDPFVLTSPTSNLRKIVSPIFYSNSFSPKVVLETFSLEFAHNFALENGMTTVILESLLNNYLPDQRCTCFSFDKQDHYSTVYLCYKKNRYLSKIMKSFISLTKQVVNERKSGSEKT
jgi:DNA-binding transcriptional LysR family regulator